MLFNVAEQLAEGEEEPALEPETQTVEAHTRKKPVRKPLPDNLPREIKWIDLPDGEKNCDKCNEPLKSFGHESSCKLDIIPASVKVIEYRRLKYVCTCEECVKISPLPKSPIPKSIATLGLLAWIITSKYCDVLPLYRQEGILKRMSIDISRATMAEWMIRRSLLLERIYTTLQDCLVKLPALQANETPLQVMNEPDRSAQNKFYMWLHRSTSALSTPIILYDYQSGRNHEKTQTFLKGFGGYPTISAK